MWTAREREEAKTTLHFGAWETQTLTSPFIEVQGISGEGGRLGWRGDRGSHSTSQAKAEA